MSNVATEMISLITINEFFGNSRLIAGKFIMNCIPLIMLQICERQPCINILRIVLPTKVTVVAAVVALLMA